MPVEYIASYSSSQLDAISGMYFFIWPGERVLFLFFKWLLACEAEIKRNKMDKAKYFM